MDIYINIEEYVNTCSNCGNCCKIPGLFLPKQIDLLATHFNLSRKEVFEKYLIAELCAPDDGTTPVFALSPVKVDSNGNRLNQKIIDHDYENIRDQFCIFRDLKSSNCSIHEIKPFGCALLLCNKMTNDEPIFLGKKYYYYQWKNNQNILYSIYPELSQLADQLNACYAVIKKSVDELEISMGIRNKTILHEIGSIFNGHPLKGIPIYK